MSFQRCQRNNAIAIQRMTNNRIHCHVCLLCQEGERDPGGLACKTKIYDRFCAGHWHNGLQWHPLIKGRALSKGTFRYSKTSRKYKQINKNTVSHLTNVFTNEHEQVVREWSDLISGFKDEGHLEQYIFYMTTHPFSKILEFRVDGYLVGFTWMLVINNIVIHQLIPWRKKQYAHLGIGKFQMQVAVDLWPSEIHLYGIESEYKRRLGGWTYEGVL